MRCLPVLSSLFLLAACGSNQVVPTIPSPPTVATPLPTDPVPPTPPVVRRSLVVELSPTFLYASAVQYQAEQRFLNVAGCGGWSTCIPSDGGAPSIDPQVALLAPPHVTVEGLSMTTPTQFSECAPVLVSGGTEGSFDGLSPLMVDGGPVDNVVPLVELEAPETPGVLSFRWEPAGQPMHLELLPTHGPQVPVVLPVDDTGTLDIPFDQLGLHPDVRGFQASLVRSRSGTRDGNMPLDWYVASTLHRMIEGGSHPHVVPARACADATPVTDGRLTLSAQSEGYLVLSPPDATSVLHATLVAGDGAALTVQPACGAASMAQTFELDDVAIAETAGGDVWIRVDTSNDPALLDLSWVQPAPDVALADTCDALSDPLDPGRWTMDASLYTDAVGASFCGNGGSWGARPEAMFPVSMPPGSMLTVRAGQAEYLALREHCGDPTTCLGTSQRSRLAWFNPSTETAELDVLVEGISSELSELDVQVVEPAAIQPSDTCGGPLLDASVPGVQGTLDGLGTEEVHTCAWGAPQKPDGFYELAIDAGETVRIDAAWDRGTFELLERCDVSAKVASGHSFDVDSRTLVYTNHTGVDRTYVLRVVGDRDPFALSIQRF